MRRHRVASREHLMARPGWRALLKQISRWGWVREPPRCPHPHPGAMKCPGALPTPCPRPVVCAGCQSEGSSGKAASRTCRAESIQEEAAEEEEQAGRSTGPNPGALPEIGDPSVW